MRNYIFLFTLPLFLSSCYSVKWSKANFSNEKTNIIAENGGLTPNIQEISRSWPHQMLEIKVLSPGSNYHYDISEKDPYYSNAKNKLVFERVTFTPCQNMPKGEALFDIYFIDKYNNYLKLPKVDLLRIIPKIDSKGQLQPAEYMLEEFSRFGVQFRKEHREFSLVVKTDEPELKAAVSRAYRVDLVNNCLDPSKWELQLVSEDYSDGKFRKKSKLNYNQDRMLSHCWFYLDKALYSALLQEKNPDIPTGLFTQSYDSLSREGESTVVDFNTLRKPIRSHVHTEITEIGHKSGRSIVPIDVETGYKKSMGLIISDSKPGFTYASLLEHPISLAAFKNEGFYTPEEPRTYDFSYLKYIDDININVIDLPASDCYVEITLGGKYAPYTFNIGNIDLATFEEQRLYGINTGINLYPKSRRYNPQQSSLTFDPDLTPDDRKAYFLMTDTKSGKWINNQFKGVEKAFLGFNNLNPGLLDIYLLSYEREMPVWYGQVRLSGALQAKIRARRSLYNF